MQDVPSSESVQSKLMQHATNCSHVLAEFYQLSAQALDAKPTGSNEYQLVMRQIMASCHLTSESVLILVANAKLWDADSLTRSVTEGSFKFIYLTLGTEQEIQDKFNEYDVALPNATRLKKHDRVQGLLAAIEHPEDDEWQALRELLLSDSEVTRLQSKYPRVQRKLIEQKWSFHSIAASFEKSSIKELASFKHLLFNYGNASHVLHQDSDGVGMIWERARRNEARRDAVELAHGARIVSDLLVMACMRCYATLRLTGSNTKVAFEFYAAQSDLHQFSKEAQSSWNEIEYPKS